MISFIFQFTQVLNDSIHPLLLSIAQNRLPRLKAVALAATAAVVLDATVVTPSLLACR